MIEDNERAREVARNDLPSRRFGGYHPRTGAIRLEAQPDDARFYRLPDHRGYSEIRIEATFSPYFDGF